MEKDLHIHIKGKRVLIEADEIETKTEAGIILAIDKQLERAGQVRGVVVDAGHLAFKFYEDETPWANVGDWVLYSRYAGQTVQDPVTKNVYTVINDEDIIAVLDRPEKEEIEE